MLRHDVVEAVRTGTFHLYAVRTVDEGLEILTGKSAGTQSATGRFTAGSINDRVDRRLEEYARRTKRYGG
jgi:predicted ATP-dependent protease